MLEINGIRIPAVGRMDDQTQTERLLKALSERLGIAPESITDIRILRRSLDLRKRSDPAYTYRIAFSCKNGERLLSSNKMPAIAQIKLTAMPAAARKKPETKKV